MIYRFGCFTFDSQARVLRNGREGVSIRPKTAQVLQFLLENRQQPRSIPA